MRALVALFLAGVGVHLLAASPAEASRGRRRGPDPRVVDVQGAMRREARQGDTASQAAEAARRDEEVGMFEEAAAGYELASFHAGAQVERPDEVGRWIERAIELRLGLGQEKDARGDELHFERALRGRSPSSVIRVGLQMARHFVEQQRWADAQARLERVAPLLPLHGTAEQRAEAGALSLRVWAGVGDTKKAEAGAKILAKAPPRRGGAAPVEAHEARFYLAERELARADSIEAPRFSGPGTRAAVMAFYRKVEPWFGKKRDANERAAQAFQRVIDGGAPPRLVIASAARVGAMWARLVGDLRSMPLLPPPRIPGLSGAELRAAYLHMLDPADEAPRQRAKEAFSACLSQALAHRHHDENVDLCSGWLSQNARAEFGSDDGYRPAAVKTEPLHEPSHPHFSSHRWPVRLP